MTDTTNEQLKLPVFTETQKKRFSSLCEKVRSGNLNANQSYRLAQIDGESQDDQGFKGSFKEWIEASKINNWLPESSADVNEPKKSTTVIKESKTDYITPIVIGLVIAGIFYTLKKLNNNK